MRIWTEVSKERNVANWLGSDLGRFFDAIEYGETLESSLMKRQSSSPNWGLVVAFARANVAICKKDWLHWTAENEPLVPIVEHGTYFRDDTNVPLWSRLPNSAPVTSHASIADCLRKWALSPK